MVLYLINKVNGFVKNLRGRHLNIVNSFQNQKLEKSNEGFGVKIYIKFHYVCKCFLQFGDRTS